MRCLLRLVSFVFLLGLFSTASLLADDPLNYYGEFRADFEGKAKKLSYGKDLRQKLFHVLRHKHISVPGKPDAIVKKCPDKKKLPKGARCYGRVKKGYGEAKYILYRYIDGKRGRWQKLVWDVYAQDWHPYKKKNAKYNAEHTWPRSRFSQQAPYDLQMADLHHIFVAHKFLNKCRGNFPLGMVEGASPLKYDGKTSKCRVGGRIPIPGINKGEKEPERYFQPPRVHQGDAARALFYFAVRYDMPIAPAQEAFLKRWSAKDYDPVSDRERARNNAVFRAQKDRNPFIDFPDLEDRIKDF